MRSELRTNDVSLGLKLRATVQKGVTPSIFCGCLLTDHIPRSRQEVHIPKGVFLKHHLEVARLSVGDGALTGPSK